MHPYAYRHKIYTHTHTPQPRLSILKLSVKTDQSFRRAQELTIKLPAVTVQLVYKTFGESERDSERGRWKRGEEGEGDECNLCKGKTG